MKITDQNFMAQMRIHELEIQTRKDMVGFMEDDAELLKDCGAFLRTEIDDIVAQFYSRLVENDDMDRIIGNADTLERLHRSMRQYIYELFVFDTGFVYDTYQQSLLNQVTIAKEKADCYARILEEKVVQRTQEINDSEGHQRGDEVLTSVGKILSAICREGDTPARIGGDEFCVILPHTTDEKSRPFCERIIAEFKKSHDGAYSLSIGIAQTGPDTVLAAEDFVPKADAAMYESKNNPDSQITIYQPTDARLHAV
ncbi:MAG: GGDEF domain-containing protein [Mariprofundaceae bacterium]|nr:GGDEF domain-containing protein [Mariprofundaceae bacterium]